MQSFPAENIS